MRIAVIRPAPKWYAASAQREISEKMIKSYASPGTELSVTYPDVSPDAGTFGGDLTEARIEAVAPLVVKEAIKAERGGFDGIVSLGEYNVGAEVTRHVVNIPFVDTGTASLHVAALVGDRICVLSPEKSVNPYARKLFKRFGMSDFVVSLKSWDISTREAWEKKAWVKEKTISLCKAAIEEEDVQVILPLCGPFIPYIMSSEEIEDEVGVPVINGIAVAVKMAEMFVNLKIHTSRKAYPYTNIGPWFK